MARTKRTAEPTPAHGILTDAAGHCYVLRTCSADMTAYGGFVWPAEGEVSAPDWEPTAQCGNGLHGLLWGEGDGGYLNWDSDARWLVVRVDPAKIVDISRKVKFPTGVVVHVGTRDTAVADIIARGADPGKCVGGTATAGDRGTATAGYGGTATAGDRGTATAGDRGTATAGYGGTATAGYGGTATAGNGGTATAGDRGTATAGDRGTATAGYGGTATAGDRGTATAGYGGTATAGDRGTATAGDRGTATAGYGGSIQVRWWDGIAERYRTAVADIGEGGYLPGVKYRVEDGKLVTAEVGT